MVLKLLEWRNILRNKMIIGIIFLIISLPGSLLPQDNRGQAEQGIVLPVLKQKGRMNRAIGNLKSFTLTGIAYAKSLGKTPEDYGKFVGELYAPFWTVRKGSAEQIVRGIYFNRQMNRNFKLEILNYCCNIIVEFIPNLTFKIQNLKF